MFKAAKRGKTARVFELLGKRNVRTVCLEPELPEGTLTNIAFGFSQFDLCDALLKRGGILGLHSIAEMYECAMKNKKDGVDLYEWKRTRLAVARSHLHYARDKVSSVLTVNNVDWYMLIDGETWYQHSKRVFKVELPEDHPHTEDERVQVEELLDEIEDLKDLLKTITENIFAARNRAFFSLYGDNYDDDYVCFD